MLEIPSPIQVLVLPGMDGTGELLTTFGEHLGKKRPVEIISYPCDEPSNYDDLVTFVIARIPQAQFVLVAESFSGPIAIEIAAATSRVLGVVLASSFARHPAPKFLASLVEIFNPRLIPRRLAASMLMGSFST